MSEETKATKFYPITWGEFHRDAKALALRLWDLGPWKGILVVTRGGLIPAGIIAHELEIRIIETVSAIGYNADNSNPMKEDDIQIIKQPANVGDGEGWLVIDDLVDTGRTFEVLRKMMPKAHFATVYAKPQGLPMVQTFIKEVSQDTWIYFPWYLEPQFVQPIALQSKKS